MGPCFILHLYGSAQARNQRYRLNSTAMKIMCTVTLTAHSFGEGEAFFFYFSLLPSKAFLLTENLGPRADNNRRRGDIVLGGRRGGKHAIIVG